MLGYFFKRVLLLIPKLLIISILIFIGLSFVPGDPIDHLIPPDQRAKLSPVQLETLRESLGLNEKLPVRYLRWISGVLKGDFGYSMVSGASIRVMIARRLPATLELAFFGLVIANILGLTLGYISSIKHNSIIDYTNTTLGIIGTSVPEFFLGLCCIAIFSLHLGWLPTGGRVAVGKETFFDRIEYLVLPVLCLAIGYIATLMRYTRGSMLDVLNKDYIKAARSKGISEFRVNCNHGLRNALIPVMIILVNRIPVLVSGAVIIENIFNYPGMGRMILDAISCSDIPVVMFSTMVIATMILVSSLLVDMLAALLDPRIRFN
ncbi:MAG: ABC transporter permease [Clostridiales bacterium]|nr:ABC transporter permease [Clostridiales bacterium]